MSDNRYIISPDIILLDSIKKLLSALRNDFLSKSNEQETMLYKILYQNTLQRYDFFTQAKTALITKESDPRHIDVNLFFNASRVGCTNIHITLGNERENDNTIGIGEGMQETSMGLGGESYQRTFNRRYNATYNLVFTSDNVNEIILIYALIKSCLISMTEHLNVSGLERIKVSGSDINLKNNEVPNGLFIRSLSISFDYNIGAIDFESTDIISEINFSGIETII